MKSSTQVNYQVRLDNAVRQLQAGIMDEGIKDHWEELRELFDKKADIADLLYGGRCGSTIEVSNKLSAYERSVHTLLDKVYEREECAEEATQLNGRFIKLQQAQSLIMDMHEELLKIHPVFASVPAVQRLKGIGAMLTEVMREIARLPIGGKGDE